MHKISHGLEGVGWDGDDRLKSWPSLIWSQSTICLGLPYLLMIWRKW